MKGRLILAMALAVLSLAAILGALMAAESGHAGARLLAQVLIAGAWAVYAVYLLRSRTGRR